MGTRRWSSLQKDEARDLEAELDRVGRENKELRAMLHAMRNDYDALQAHAERIKREIAGRTESSSSHGSPKRRDAELPRPKTSRVLVRTEASDTSLIVKDGYQWRKYGQKVTKDNPSPRAYYRCARAPECPVKKKVQRCASDQLVLVATYEGEHNHDAPGASDGSNPLNGSLVGPDAPTPASPLSVNPSKPTVTVNLTLSGGTNPERTRAVPNIPRSASNKRKKNFGGGYRSNSSSISGDGGGGRTKRDSNGVAAAANGGSNRSLEEYMSSLMRDPDFTTALAGAVASSILRVRPAGG